MPMYTISERHRHEAEAGGWLPRNHLLLHRQELYDRVWSTPTSELANEFGLSDVMLGKLCQQLQIPKPPRGYWQRLANGQTPPIEPLPAVSEDQPSILVIPPREIPIPKPPPDPTLPERIQQELAPERRIVVADELRSPHPLVKQTRESLAHAKPHWGITLPVPLNTPCLDITVSKPTLPRALRLMDALLKALEVRGCVVSLDKERKQATCVTMGEARMELRLAERIDRQEKPPAKTARPSQWIPDYERWIYTPTNILTLTITGPYGGGNGQWRDAEGKPLEDRLNDVIIRMMKIAEAYRVHELEMAERRRRAEEEERRRAEAERRRQHEEERRKLLEDQAERWSKSQNLRAFLRVCEERLNSSAAGTNPNGPEAQWLAWAHAHADRLDPLAQGYLEQAVAELQSAQGPQAVPASGSGPQDPR